jgi:hypothetical protein
MSDLDSGPDAKGPLATLSIVKAKLDIPDTETIFDVALQSAIGAVNRRIQRLTGYSLVAIQGQVDILRNIQVGREFRTKLRPITNLTDVSGKLIGNDEYETAEADLLDPEEGLIMIVPGSWSEWPPIRREREAPWFRHNEWFWDLLRITYDVEGWVPEEDITDMANNWAIFLYHRSGAGATDSRSEGVVSEKLLNEPIPVWVRGLLADFVRERVSWGS